VAEIFLYAGEPNPSDVKLADPTVVIAGGGGPQPVSITEAATGTDSPERTAIFPVSIDETVSATDTPVAGTLLPAAILEAASAADSPDGTALLPVAIAETASVEELADATVVPWAPPVSGGGGAVGRWLPVPRRRLGHHAGSGEIELSPARVAGHARVRQRQSAALALASPRTEGKSFARLRHDSRAELTAGRLRIQGESATDFSAREMELALTLLEL